MPRGVVKLILCGGGFGGDSLELDRMAIEITGKSRPRMTYIPSCHYGAEEDFRDFVKYYNKLGVEKFVLFPVDIPFDQSLLKLVLKSDVIHLSGGNTYYFLKHLRRSGMLGKLKKFVFNGGVLMGMSAGGILMTPSIISARYPSFDQDINEDKIKNLNSLNLAKFEFCPHYKNSKRYDRELVGRSKKISFPLYACPDDGGIVVDEDKLAFVGRCYAFFRGNKMPLFY